MGAHGQLLVIEDNDADYAHYLRLLEDEGHEFSQIIRIADAQEAFEFLCEQQPDCCLLDYQLSGGTASELLARLRTQYGTHHIPMVVSTSVGDERLAVELMQLGVQDYLVKSRLTGSELLRALKSAMRTASLQRELYQMAHYDPLTGLLNRALFMNRLEQAVAEAARYRRPVCLLYMDVDHFKQINDAHGHDIGDAVLKVVAERARHTVRASDSVARLGGDEFVILLPQTTLANAEEVVAKLLDNIAKPVQLEQTEIKLSVSIGLSAYPDTAHDPQQLITQADAALYRAKRQGRGQGVGFSASHKDEWRRQTSLIEALPSALGNDAVTLAFQPVWRFSDGICVEVEALVRWQHQGEWISALEVVQLIEKGTLALPYHEWLFNQALRQLQHWQQAQPGLELSLNMPMHLCLNQAVIDHLYESMEKYQIDPAHVTLELPEVHLVKYPEATASVLRHLQERGLSITIDDFGQGGLPMADLAGLPCRRIKMHQKFLLEMEHDEKNRRIVLAILAAGHVLGFEVYAKGVENAELAQFVRAAGCDGAQGYWCGKPRFATSDWQEFLDLCKS